MFSHLQESQKKINLTVNFMKRQMKEYDELKRELEQHDIDIEEIKKIRC